MYLLYTYNTLNLNYWYQFIFNIRSICVYIPTIEYGLIFIDNLVIRTCELLRR